MALSPVRRLLLPAALSAALCHCGTSGEPTTVEYPAAPAPADLTDYTETIPGSGIRFDMVAVPGGRFRIGSPSGETGRDEDEGPQREVELSPFWIGKHEVSWDEFQAYYAASATRGKNEEGAESDAVTGPTPPYGSPDQGWGKGRRPAITMTHHAATQYCRWLSETTGRPYRLPTEAEWEYACRAGTQRAYFFQKKSETGWWDAWFGEEFPQEELGEHAWYRANSRDRTHPAGEKRPNPWGLFDMAGNVKEFCRDFYAADAYSRYPEGVVQNPSGPADGEEHVVRGGSYAGRPADLRCAARDRTRHWDWLKTDPQSPKSVWWYSDNNEVGFRVVRPYAPSEPRPDPSEESRR